MKKLSILLAGTTLLCALPVSLQWSPQGKLSVAFDAAIAEIGRPWTATNVAGVHRRTARRAARQAYYGDGTYGDRYGSRYGVGTAVVAAGAAATTTAYDTYAMAYGNDPRAYGDYRRPYGEYAGGVYRIGAWDSTTNVGNSNLGYAYPTRVIVARSPAPATYYGPICNPRFDPLCQ